jgi:hypothetical protein
LRKFGVKQKTEEVSSSLRSDPQSACQCSKRIENSPKNRGRLGTGCHQCRNATVPDAPRSPDEHDRQNRRLDTIARIATRAVWVTAARMTPPDPRPSRSVHRLRRGRGVVVGPWSFVTRARFGRLAVTRLLPAADGGGGPVVRPLRRDAFAAGLVPAIARREPRGLTAMTAVRLLDPHPAGDRGRVTPAPHRPRSVPSA